MMDHVKSKKITAQYDLEDFQRDLKTVAVGERRRREKLLGHRGALANRSE
jgi:hypothetical protein